MARSFGFRGALVPGVTVTAYLCHPAIEAWGTDWLERGKARAVVHTPLYDRKRFRLELADPCADAYDAALAGNVRMDAWLHRQTEPQYYRPVPRGSELVVESAIADLFEKKGHEFVDLDVAAFLLDTRQAVLSARLRAIYQLRGG